ncbi:4-oxalocrotonate tautomerase family enzyme [Geotoga petraea]|uniref:4-oxalocrotonate tautomerase family enzyme n=2 Tax=Geotoga petraea TaxID=28234 RepID=A0A1G6M4W2_9BACT|nr:4-oxalocrotonate tautomerase family enzyme [Geotoga petraea]
MGRETLLDISTLCYNGIGIKDELMGIGIKYHANYFKNISKFKGGVHMPFIQFDGGKMTKEKKAELVAKLTETAQEVLGIPTQAFSVIIRENDMDNIGQGGKLLSENHK